MSEFKKSFSPETKLPENIIHDQEHHLVYTNNLSTASKAIILVTGYPEGPNILADLKPKQTLDEIFSLAPTKETAFIQTYLGPSLLALKRLPSHINKALELVEGKPTTMAVFSFGAQSLKNLQIPETINHLALISPIVSPDCLQGKLTSLAVKTFGKTLSIPSATEYRQNISPLINHIQTYPQFKLDLILGTKDSIANSEKIKEILLTIFPKIALHEKNRDHVPPNNELIELLFPKT